MTARPLTGRRLLRAEVQSTWTVLEAQGKHAGFRAADMQVAEGAPEPVPERAAPVLLGLMVGLR